MRLQRILVLVLAAVLTVLAGYIVAGQRFAYGPVLLRAGDDHGVHLTDLPIAGLWAIGVGICAALWRAPTDRG